MAKNEVECSLAVAGAEAWLKIAAATRQGLACLLGVRNVGDQKRLPLANDQGAKKNDGKTGEPGPVGHRAGFRRLSDSDLQPYTRKNVAVNLELGNHAEQSRLASGWGQPSHGGGGSRQGPPGSLRRERTSRGMTSRFLKPAPGRSASADRQVRSVPGQSRRCAETRSKQPDRVTGEQQGLWWTLFTKQHRLEWS